MKKIRTAFICALALCSVLAFAQSAPFGAFRASDYAYGLSGLNTPPALRVAPGGGAAAGTATLTLSFGSIALSRTGRNIMPLSVTAPITVDTGANMETVT